MAKPRTPNQKKRYAALNKRLAKYVSLVQSIYDSLALDAASIVTSLTDYSADTERPFRFKDYPLTKTRVNELMRFFSHDLQALIYAGTTEEWKQSNLVQDLLANDVLKVYGMRRNGEKVKRYYQPNNDALRAFQQRKDKGFTVSQKVWNQSYNFRRELEYAISSGIERGQSAVTLSKRISKYLHDYPSLCDDYKERYGTAVDCKNCEYRSIRLAASEINMAYRTAEQTRWQQMDFIKGYEIKLSGSHPKYDVCDELAGIYPKWFKWTGWHPNCRCICIPIVMTDDEWYSGKGKVIDELPENFIEWAENNQGRIKESIKHDTTPYFVRDNIKEIYSPKYFHKNEDGDYVRNTIFNDETEENIRKARETPGEFIKISTKEIKERLMQLCEDFTHEEAYIVFEDGRVYHKIGTKIGVHFTKDEARTFKGCKMYHNHTSEEFDPLSYDDITFSYHNQLKSIHAITKDKVYNAYNPKEIKMYSKAQLQNIVDEASFNVEASRKKMNSKEADAARILSRHLTALEVCRLLDVKYRITKM